jgi:hypothetical protein
MVVEITRVEIGKEEIRLCGTNLETILTSENLFEEMEAEEINFVFEKDKPSERKYLYKVCQSQKSTKNKKSLGEKIEALPGCILSLSENFIEK